MNGAQIHLLVNHIPTLGLLFCAGLAGWALWKRTPSLKQAALGGFVLIASFTLLPFLSGESAEERIEGMPGISEIHLERHEDAAAWALGMTLLVGIVALAALWRGRREPRWLDRGTALALALSVPAFGVVAYVAHQGGQINHPEIRDPATPDRSAQAAKDQHAED